MAENMSPETSAKENISMCTNGVVRDKEFVEAVMAPKVTSRVDSGERDISLSCDIVVPDSNSMDCVSTYSGRKRALSAVNASDNYAGQTSGESSVTKKRKNTYKGDLTSRSQHAQGTELDSQNISYIDSDTSATSPGSQDNSRLMKQGFRYSDTGSNETLRILSAIENLKVSFRTDLAQLEEKLTNNILQTVRSEIDNVKKDFSIKVDGLAHRVK